MKARLVLVAAAALTALLVLLSGCGGSEVSGPATLAPPNSLVFAEGTLRPSGELKTNVEAIAGKAAGIKDLGGVIAVKLELKAREEGKPFDFEKEVEPWLGERAGVWSSTLRDGNLAETVIAVETTDRAAAQKFIDKQVAANGNRTGGDYKGVEYAVDHSDGSYAGIVGDYVVSAEGERAFKATVDAFQGEALSGEDRYTSIASAAPDGALANVYVDVAGLIRRSGTKISDQALRVLQSAGVDLSGATVLASVVPGPDQVEVDLSSDLGGERAPSGDASKLLGSLPAGSFAALAVSGFGEQLKEALDSLDASGIPPDVPPHRLKRTVREAGIDLDSLVSSLRDAALFAVGSDRAGLGGALILTTSDPNRATNTVSNIGLLLRGAGVPGVTALTGKAAGFSIHSPELGRKPLVIAAQSDRIAIGYGAAATLRGLAAAPGKTLADTPDYAAAVSSLGDTPISAFVDGPAALSLASALVPRSNRGFQEAKPFLGAIRFIAVGSAEGGNLVSAKLIVGLKK